jgi:uncharacterized protein YndB with AHSA1/START domain
MSKKPRQHHGRIIDTEIRIKNSPMRVWQAWADPEHIANWFVDRAEGSAQPGEVMTWYFDTFKYRQPVPIIEADPGRTLVIGSGDQPGPQGLPYLMEITITAEGGTTTMRLVNSGFSEDANFDDEYGGVVSGWKMALATLKQWLERYPDKRRTHRIVMQPAPYTPETLRPWFHTIDGRKQWIGDIVPADSQILADTGREVLLQWAEQDAVVGLKAFKMGPARMLALDVSTWAPTPEPLIGVAPELERALSKLTIALHRPE